VARVRNGKIPKWADDDMAVMERQLPRKGDIKTGQKRRNENGNTVEKVGRRERSDEMGGNGC